MNKPRENIQMAVSENQTNDIQQTTQQSASSEPSVILTDIEVKDENVALNLFVSFLNLAQRRGAYNMQESAKIWECIIKFKRNKDKSNDK